LLSGSFFVGLPDDEMTTIIMNESPQTKTSNNSNNNNNTRTAKNGNNKRKNNNNKTSLSSSAVVVSSSYSSCLLHPTVKIPVTLQAHDLEGCQDLVAELAGYSPHLQQSTLVHYNHTLRSIAGKDKNKNNNKKSLSDKRRNEILARCLQKTKETQQQCSSSSGNNQSATTPTAETSPLSPPAAVAAAETRQDQPTSPSPQQEFLSLSRAISSETAPPSIVLPKSRINLGPSAASMVHSMNENPSLQYEALVACDEAALKMRHSSGETKIAEQEGQFLFTNILKSLVLQQQAQEHQQEQPLEQGTTTDTSTTTIIRQSKSVNKKHHGVSMESSQRKGGDSHDDAMDVSNGGSILATCNKKKNKEDNRTPVTLPTTKFKLEESAAILFHDMDTNLQQEALVACDQAALDLLQKGSSVKKPVEFFTTVLQKLQNKHNNNTRGTTTINNKLTTTSSATRTTSDKKGGILKLDHSNNNINNKDTSKISSKNKPVKVQILHKASTPPAKPLGHDRSSSNGVELQRVNSCNEEAEHTIVMLKRQLEDRTRQHRDLEKKTWDLTKLWEAEKYSVSAYKERITTLEAAIQKLQHQLVEKDVFVEEQLKQARHRQQEQIQQQGDYKDMMNAFMKLSKELCHVQEEKRDLEQIIETEKTSHKTKDEEIRQLKAELKRSEMLRPTPRNNDVESQRVQALQRQLRQTQEKLAKLAGSGDNNNNNSSDNKIAGAKKTSVYLVNNKEKLSLADFVLESGATPQILQRPSSSSIDNDERGATQILQTSSGLLGYDETIQLLQRPHRVSSTSNSSDVAPHLLEVELPSQAVETTLTECQQQQQPSEAESKGILFHGIGKGYDETDEEDNVDTTTTEIDFLLASFEDGELQVDSDERRVTRTLHLDIARNSEVVAVHLILSLPEGYPTTAPLQVEASLAPEINPSVPARKVTMDALPDLVNVCRWEANGSVGRQALFSVLQTADKWVENEWHGIQAKRLPADASGKACLLSTGAGSKLQIARILLSTHHLVDADKIGLVKTTASHYNLGGYMKCGYPGLILVEGLEDNCTFFVESIVQQRMKLRNKSKAAWKSDSSTFSVAGTVVVDVEEDLDGERKLPKKLIEIDKSREGMECFREFCTGVDLDKYLN
jgi:hypothetical protein